jgi:hypothetical protein
MSFEHASPKRVLTLKEFLIEGIKSFLSPSLWSIEYLRMRLHLILLGLFASKITFNFWVSDLFFCLVVVFSLWAIASAYQFIVDETVDFPKKFQNLIMWLLGGLVGLW